MGTFRAGSRTGDREGVILTEVSRICEPEYVVKITGLDHRLLPDSIFGGHHHAFMDQVGTGSLRFEQRLCLLTMEVATRYSRSRSCFCATAASTEHSSSQLRSVSFINTGKSFRGLSIE